MCLKILLFQTLLITDSSGIDFFCKKECSPITPSPTLLSLIAEYLASLKESGALLIKSVKTLSKNLITSSIKSELFFHSSYVSKFNEDKQHTAVLSLPSLSIPVGN